MSFMRALHLLTLKRLCNQALNQGGQPDRLKILSNIIFKSQDFSVELFQSPPLAFYSTPSHYLTRRYLQSSLKIVTSSSLGFAY